MDSTWYKRRGGGGARKKIGRSNRAWEARRGEARLVALAAPHDARRGAGEARRLSADFFHRRREVSREVTEFTPVIYTRRSRRPTGVGVGRPERGKKGARA